jgi:Ca2+-binding RTX toxin-like protein
MVDYILTEGADYFTPQYAQSSVYALGGNDTILFGVDLFNMVILGGDGDDYISGVTTGHAGNFQLQGGNGNDYIQGAAGNSPINDIDGGLGDDTLLGVGFQNTVRGGDGNDWIRVVNGIAWGDAG